MLTKRKGESYKSAPCEVYIEEKRYKIKKRQKKRELGNSLSSKGKREVTLLMVSMCKKAVAYLYIWSNT